MLLVGRRAVKQVSRLELEIRDKYRILRIHRETSKFKLDN